MKVRILLLILFAASSASADRTLRWSRLAVTAHLDADGRLHVQERHSIVFNGDWNGGERIFRKNLENVLHLERISRVVEDSRPRLSPLNYDKSLKHVDDYAWSDSNTLRWRSRLPSDPPFKNQEITYLIEYTDSNILIPTDGAYILDHNFGLPDLQWPIDAYSLDLTSDPVWQPNVARHITRANQPHGENVTVTERLRHAGTAPPAAVNAGAPPPIRYALLALLFGGTALIGFLFLRRERAIGRFEPLPDLATIDRQWLDANVFKFLPEVVGAAWDDRTDAPEVAAVIARMVHEGKLSSRVDKGGFLKNDNLVLTLLRKKESLDGYEASLVKSLFIDGDTTSTEKIKAYYKARKKGFDPVSKIRDPLQRKVSEIGKKGSAPKVSWTPTVILLLAGLALLILGGFFSGPLSIVGGTIAACIVLAFFVAGLIGALDYRRRVTRLGISAIEFVPPVLLILAVPAIAFNFRFSVWTLAGLVVISLAAIRAIFSAAMSRDAGERLENRRRLAAARDWFARELRQTNPALEDAWFPYLLAFGLGANVDRWFHAFGGKSTGSSPSSFGSTSTSTSSSGSGWTGGGGAFGGAGASGAWGVAAAGMAAGVSAPGSGGGGGGGGGGGSSGGGGGGGW